MYYPTACWSCSGTYRRDDQDDGCGAYRNYLDRQRMQAKLQPVSHMTKLNKTPGLALVWREDW